MANAARHSGAEKVSTFVDVGDEEIAVFVRDRGSGFDTTKVSKRKHGLAESIRGRMDRAGGTAVVTSIPGEGTEVELRLRRPS
jgi:signal transduction histidine kinase